MRPPSAGPIRFSVAQVSVEKRAPLARARSTCRTISGSTAWLALATSVWPTPIRNTVRSSAGRAPRSAATATAKRMSTAARAHSTVTTRRRRSTRSTTAPAGRATSSHGSRAATVTPTMSLGSSVRWVASNGKAANARPSPMPETPVLSCNQPKGAAERPELVPSALPSSPVPPGRLPDYSTHLDAERPGRWASRPTARTTRWCWSTVAPRRRGGRRPTVPIGRGVHQGLVNLRSTCCDGPCRHLLSGLARLETHAWRWE